MDDWKRRAKNYNKLQWVQNSTLMKELIRFSALTSEDCVVDIGCGTGAVSKAIVNIAKRIIALDNSKEMLSQVPVNNKIHTILWDIEQETYPGEFANILIARMIFHDIENLKQTFKNCYLMLKSTGWLIVQEGLPPCDRPTIRQWYAEMMAYKEKRHTFLACDLFDLFNSTGFKNVTMTYIFDENFSVNNWLENSGLDDDQQTKIYNIHLKAPTEIKAIYNMRVINKVNQKEEILIRTRSILIKGQK